MLTKKCKVIGQKDITRAMNCSNLAVPIRSVLSASTRAIHEGSCAVGVVWDSKQPMKTSIERPKKMTQQDRPPQDQPPGFNPPSEAKPEAQPSPSVQSAPEVQPPPSAQPAPKAQPSPAPNARTYTVQSGDTLSDIAQRTYGNAGEWLKIFEANQNVLGNPDVIFPGTVIVLPD